MKKNFVKMLALTGTAVLAMGALAGCGSGAGVEAVSSGTADIGNSSRNLDV